MSASEIVLGSEAQSILAMACQRQVNIAAAVQIQNRWLAYRSRMHQAGDGRVLIETPAPAEGVDFEKGLLGQECSLNFRLNSHRYFFTARPELAAGPASKDGLRLLSIPSPATLERQERRTMDRVDVPAKESVRASVWASADRRPIWSGSVLNMSGGGFQMRSAGSALNFFEIGDRVAVELSFGPDGKRLALETHFRYGQKDGNMAMLGLEFIPIDPGSSPEIREAMRIILDKTEAFRKA